MDIETAKDRIEELEYYLQRVISLCIERGQGPSLEDPLLMRARAALQRAPGAIKKIRISHQGSSEPASE